MSKTPPTSRSWLCCPDKIRTCLELTENMLYWLEAEVRTLVKSRARPTLQIVLQRNLATFALGTEWLLGILDGEIAMALLQPDCDAPALQSCERALHQRYQRWLDLVQIAAAEPQDPFTWVHLEQRIKGVTAMLDPTHPLNCGLPMEAAPEPE